MRGFVPDVILHTAAYTNVDGAEDDEETAFAVNALGTRNLVEASARHAHADRQLLERLRLRRRASASRTSRATSPTRWAPTGAPSSLRSARRSPGCAAPWCAPRGCSRPTATTSSRRSSRRRASAPPRTPTRPNRCASSTTRPARRPMPAIWPRRVLDALLRAAWARGIYHFAGGGQCTWCELAREVVARRRPARRGAADHDRRGGPAGAATAVLGPRQRARHPAAAALAGRRARRGRRAARRD